MIVKNKRKKIYQSQSIKENKNEKLFKNKRKKSIKMKVKINFYQNKYENKIKMNLIDSKNKIKEKKIYLSESKNESKIKII